MKAHSSSSSSENNSNFNDDSSQPGTTEHVDDTIITMITQVLRNKEKHKRNERSRDIPPRTPDIVLQFSRQIDNGQLLFKPWPVNYPIRNRDRSGCPQELQLSGGFLSPTLSESSRYVSSSSMFYQIFQRKPTGSINCTTTATRLVLHFPIFLDHRFQGCWRMLGFLG